MNPPREVGESVLVKTDRRVRGGIVSQALSGQWFCRQEALWMCDMLVMEQNLFGAGSVHHVAANRASITLQI